MQNIEITLLETKILPTFTHFAENSVCKHKKENNFREEKGVHDIKHMSNALRQTCHKQNQATPHTFNC